MMKLVDQTCQARVSIAVGIGFALATSAYAQTPGFLRRADTLRGHESTVDSVLFLPDGKTLVSGSADSIRFWNVATGELVTTLTRKRGMSQLALSPNGETLASGGNGPIRLWSCSRRKEQRPLVTDFGTVHALEFSPDGKLLAIAGLDDNTVRLFDVEHRREVAVLRGHRFVVSGLGFTPDGKTLASAGPDGLRFWRICGRKIVELKAIERLDALTLTMHPKGDILALTQFFGRADPIILWDIQSERRLHLLKGHKQTPIAVAFSPQGKLLASGSADKTFRIWDVGTGQQLASIAVHDHLVLSVSFSPKGGAIATGGFDKTIGIWEISSGPEVEKR